MNPRRRRVGGGGGRGSGTAWPAPLLVALLALAACQGNDAKPGSRAADRQARAAPPRPLSGNAAIAGGVYLASAAPARTGPPAAPDCIPPGAPVDYDPALLRASTGALGGVFVWVFEGAPAVPLEAGAAPVEIALDDCGFHPRTVAARVGQALRVTNRGDRHRTVVARDDRGTLFELTLAPGGSALAPQFRRTAVMARLVTEDEPPARAYAGVVEHPFFTVTDTTGAFALTQLPGGAFAVAAWHEVLGQVVHRIAVEDGAMIIVDFPLQAAGRTGGTP